MAIYLYTGEGGGKTTNALGLALRSVGHGKKVVIIQFMKWWKKTGEWKIQKKLAPYYSIYQFGRKGWIGLKRLKAEDELLAEKAFEFVKNIAKKEKPPLLVLDEIILAIYCKLLDENEVIKFLKSVPKSIDVVLTGRHASKKLIAISDYANEIRILKMPKKISARKGIQY